jgi:hypothetical protein
MISGSSVHVDHCIECASESVIRKGDLKISVGNTYFSICLEHAAVMHTVTGNALKHKNPVIKASWGGAEMILEYENKYIKYPTKNPQIMELGKLDTLEAWKPYEPQIIEVKLSSGSSITLSGTNGIYTSINPVKVTFLQNK